MILPDIKYCTEPTKTVDIATKQKQPGCKRVEVKSEAPVLSMCTYD